MLAGLVAGASAAAAWSLSVNGIGLPGGVRADSPLAGFGSHSRFGDR